MDAPETYVEKLRSVMKEKGEAPWPGLDRNGKLWRSLDEFRNEMFELHPWDRRIFMPDAFWLKFGFRLIAGLEARINPGGLLELESSNPEIRSLFEEHILPSVHVLEALAAWRPGQDVAVFDPDILEQMKRENMFKRLPAELFMTFPAWAVWFPGQISTHGDDYHGFFAQIAMMERIPLMAITFFRFHEPDDFSGAEIPEFYHRYRHPTFQQRYIVPIGDWSLEEAVAKVNRINGRILPDSTQKIDAGVIQAMNMIAYVCARGLKEDESQDSGAGFENPVPARRSDRRHDRLFPAQKARIWKIGERDGEAIRNYERKIGEYERKTGRIIPPHMRHGYFEGFWTGPRKEPEKRKIVIHYIPPTMVRGTMDFEDEDAAADGGRADAKPRKKRMRI